MERTTLSAASLQELQHKAYIQAANGQSASGTVTFFVTCVLVAVHDFNMFRCLIHMYFLVDTGLVFFIRVMSFAIGALLVCANLFYLLANNTDLGQGHSLEYPLRHTTLTESFEFPLSSPQHAPPNPSLRYNMPSPHSAIRQPADVTILGTHLIETKVRGCRFY